MYYHDRIKKVGGCPCGCPEVIRHVSRVRIDIPNRHADHHSDPVKGQGEDQSTCAGALVATVVPWLNSAVALMSTNRDVQRIVLAYCSGVR
jgi:hypothetical protein